MSEQANQVIYSNRQQKSKRAKRILMKQKCRNIDHQISEDLEKLDMLLNMLKQQKELSTIKQVQEDTTFEDNSAQYDKNQNETRKERKLKFKYSILREYQFLEDSQNEISAKMQEMLRETIDSTIKESGQDEILLDELSEIRSNQASNLEFIENVNLIQAFGHSLNPFRKISFKRSQFSEMDQIQSIRVKTRYDWIKKYLEQQFKDTIVKAQLVTGEEIRLLKYDSKEDHFEYEVQEENYNDKAHDLTTTSTPTRNYSIQKTFLPLSFQMNYKYRDFLNDNPEIEVSFPRHNHSIKIIDPTVQQVTRLKLDNHLNSIRLLVKSQNNNTQNMQRIMIFKELSFQDFDQKYKIVWTKYDKQAFTEDIILQSGYNYLITNICCNPSSEVCLIFNSDDVDYVKIQKTNYDPWKSYNILCSSFEQCDKVFMSQNVFDDQKPLEFMRANFLDYGLVLEIYQNIYTEKVAFLKKKQGMEERVQDISLLFPDIYTQLQNKNVYLADQLVIKFFEVTQKPARLYFPEKRVLIGSKIVENVTVHSTFK